MVINVKLEVVNKFNYTDDNVVKLRGVYVDLVKKDM